MCENCKRLLELIREAKKADSAMWNAVTINFSTVSSDEISSLSLARTRAIESLFKEVE